MLKVAIIGTGNVGFHFFNKLREIHSVTVFSRSQTTKTSDLKKFDSSKFDIALLAVADDAISEVSNDIPLSECIVLHTSGSRSIEDLSKHNRHGVLYPLQTFSKEKEIDFNSFPMLIEGTQNAIAEITSFVNSFSSNVRKVSSEDRSKIHLAAVFACNFTNHMYAISDSIMSEIGMSFNDLKHLTTETLEKALSNNPKHVQTGPAIRNDEKTMRNHLKMIDSEEVKKIYELISQDIHKGH